jgi:penicillin G amidase
VLSLLTVLQPERAVKSRTRILLGIGIVVLLSGLAAFLFLRYQATKSFPVTTGRLTLAGLRAPVTVHRDPYGVPCIEARDEHDLMFALGFVHAQDRLWQMDMARRIGRGRLSELLGPVTVPFDRMFRIIGIRDIARKEERGLSSASRDRLVWYAAGVNALIAMQKGRLPVEFDMLDYRPDPWEPVDCLILARLMAWDLNLSWWTDLTMGSIAEKVGLDRALDILPSYPAGVDPAVPAGEWRLYAGAGTGFLKTAQAFRAFEGAPGILGGSNAWVVGPQKSATGKVILANDVHLQLQCPSRFYEVHLRAPGYDVGGFSLPGVPGIVLGRNATIAWGLTNVMADDADFYIERIDSVDPRRYATAGGWETIVAHDEEILVKGDTAVVVTVRSTRHGPIVTDVRTMLQRAHPPYVASMRWTGQDPGDAIEAFNRINRARNWQEFTDGVRLFPGPGQNFVYGDIQGNIGYWCGMKLPVRGKQNSTLPLPGWDPAVDWKGFVPFEQLPHRYNPPEGYLATANNKLVDDSYPWHISDLWEPPARILRLREILGREGTFTAADFERMQNDRMSPHAREILPYILEAFRDSSLKMPEHDLVFTYLRNWNFVFSPEDVATGIYQQFFVSLLKNIYEDEMGEDLFHDFVILVNVPIRVTTRLLADGTSPWFDDIRTPEVETRDDIIRRSLRDAVEALRGRFGPGMKTWRWGDMHTVTLQHLFGLRKPLDRVFSIGPFPYGGGSTTLISGEYSFNQPFEVTVGAAVRQIVDFSHPDGTIRVLAGGQSGQVLHRHYDDQALLWLNGGYRSYHPLPTRGMAGGWEELQLEPAP